MDTNYDININGIVEIAKCLSHPTRIKIIELLKKNPEGMFLIEIVRTISKKSNYKSEYTSVKTHIMELSFSGITALVYKNNKYFVRLLKEIKIEVIDIKPTTTTLGKGILKENEI